MAAVDRPGGSREAKNQQVKATATQRGPIEKGPTTERVAANIRHYREAKGLNPQELSDRVAGLGRHINQSSIWKIESGARRVDVDDLVALALALGVTPDLLLLRTSDSDPGTSADAVELTPHRTATPLDTWRWASGLAPLPGDDIPREQFRRDNRPHVKDSVPLAYIGKNLDLLQVIKGVEAEAQKRGTNLQQLVAVFELADIEGTAEADDGSR
jgi:transcriptional regulator with XRE-family HTH domain